MNGEIEINEPVRVYDTSGPWGDPDFHGDVTQGLPPLRAKWIRERGDVEEINGREVQPIDDGFLSEKHAAIAAQRSTPNAQRPTFNGAGAPSRRRPLRASVGHPVTQLAYARRGIITPEMEFIAIRENLGREMQKENRELSKRMATTPNFVTIFTSAYFRLAITRTSNNRRNSVPTSRRDNTRIRAVGSRARSRHHSRKHQSSRIRADDHRP